MVYFQPWNKKKRQVSRKLLVYVLKEERKINVVLMNGIFTIVPIDQSYNPSSRQTETTQSLFSWL